MFRELYDYRELLKTSVKKDIRGKYKASVLGVLWSFINPLLQVLVYAIIFPHLLGRTGQNYVVYLVTGIIPWTYFSNVINDCVGCIKNNSGIIQKVYFPRVILPVSCACSGFINFMISCMIILVFCLLYGIGISWQIILVPLIALIEGILALGLGMALGAMDAYVQDLQYITNFILMMAFYASPIVYQMDLLSSGSTLSKMILINPVTQIIMAYRDVFLYHRIPDLKILGLVFVFAGIVFLIGYLIFKKLEKGFAEQF